MPRFYPFALERMLSRLEQEVTTNLSESGVHPVSLGELLQDAPGLLHDLLRVELNYPHVNGSPTLRERVARLYRGATQDHVLITVGAAEANYLAIRTLLQPGDEIVIMLPNYMQIYGIAQNHGLRVRPFHLREDRGWAPDLDELGDALTSRTRLVAVCHPNNPTGAVLTEEAMDAIVAAAEKVGAWLLADEVYRGAERTTEEESPSFFGRYDRVLAVGSLSKAYGLPGLRIGWVVGPPATVDDIWARHEYTTLSATMLSNHLAAVALSPEVRPRLRDRARALIRRGFPVLEEWCHGHQGLFDLVPPQASAIAFLRYHHEVSSTELVDRLVREESVLMVPGDHFGVDHHLRVSFGLPHEILRAGLDGLDRVMSRLGA